MNTAIGKRLATLRNKKNLSQAELAEKLSVNISHIAEWEAGQTALDIPVIPALADALDVSIEYLLRGEASHMQKIFIGYPFMQKYNIDGKPMITGINESYLARGWRVVSIECTNDTKDEFFTVVLER